MEKRHYLVHKIILGIISAVLLICAGWANMAVFAPVKPATPSTPITPLIWNPTADLLSKNGKWRISIDSGGNLRIFQMEAFRPTSASTGPWWSMSMLYNAGNGGTSEWDIEVIDAVTNTSAGITTTKFGSTIDQNATTLRPTEGSPIFQTRTQTVGTFPIKTTTFLEPVNNEKLLLVGLTVKNESSTNTIKLNMRMFMDTMMNLYNGSSVYGDDYVPVVLTPANNVFIARAIANRNGQGSGSHGTMPAPGAQYLIYYNNTPNITNADFWWAGRYGQGVGTGNFWYGYKTGVVAGTGFPSDPAEFNQAYAEATSTLNYPGGNGGYDTSASVWYTNRVLAPGEEVTVKFAVGMSINNNPPVLESLSPSRAMINTIRDKTTSMNIEGKWYDNDSPNVDIYGVVDGGSPVKYGGGSLSNDAPRYSGPQTGITGPPNRSFDVDYDLSLYDDGDWHIVDYYIEDPSQLVSNQKSVSFVLYALDPITNSYEYINDTYSEAKMKGSLDSLRLPPSAKVVEVGFVYQRPINDLPPDSLSHNTRGGLSTAVASDWDGNRGSIFTGTAISLDPTYTYYYSSYAKVEWTDPITGEIFYDYVYSIPAPMSTFYLLLAGPLPSPTGSVMTSVGGGTASGSSTINSNGTPNFGGNSTGNSGLTGNSNTNVQLDAGLTPYTPSVTMTPKPQKTTPPKQIVDETVDDSTEAIPVTGYGRIVVLSIVGGLILISIVVMRRKHSSH